MKTFLLLFGLALTVSVYGQSSDEVLEKEMIFRGQGIVLLESGEELIGEIVHTRQNSDMVSVYKPGEKKPMKIKVEDAKQFTIGTDTMFVKVKSTTSEKFVQYLVNKDNKIKVYDATYQTSVVRGGDSKSGFIFPTNKEYWVLFPEREKAISIKDISLSKGKVAEYVKECQSLSEKIESKAIGYRLGGLVPIETLLETYIKISEEFEICN